MAVHAAGGKVHLAPAPLFGGKAIHMARAPEIVRRTVRHQGFQVLDDRVDHVRAREAIRVHNLEPLGEVRILRKARGDARERSAPAEVRVFDHLAHGRMEIRQAPVVEVRRGERGVVHGTRQYAVVDLRIRAAGPQMVAGAAHKALRNLRTRKAPVVEQRPPQLGASLMVGEFWREGHEQARAGRVDSELPVKRLPRGGRLRLQPGRLGGRGLPLGLPVPRHKGRRHEDKNHARTDGRPENAPRHLNGSFP